MELDRDFESGAGLAVSLTELSDVMRCWDVAIMFPVSRHNWVIPGLTGVWELVNVESHAPSQ